MAKLHEKVSGFRSDLAKSVGKVMATVDTDRINFRSNWSVTWSPHLAPNPDRYLLNPEKVRRIFPGAPVVEDGVAEAVRRLDTQGFDSVFIKVEYQTLRRLPSFPATAGVRRTLDARRGTARLSGGSHAE